MTEHLVLFSEIPHQTGHLGVITLNRPQVLNALNDTMIHAMYAQLKKWAEAKHIKAVVINAVAGRAFCAGGDIRLTYQEAQTNKERVAYFFSEEYKLNQLIFHYPKPYIALLDGITMGGGAGISINGSHRVATENMLFAMPETSIGFFPDVGGTYFLPRLRGYSGFYLGLTGARIQVDDCVILGVTQHKVQSSALPHLLDALVAEDLGDNAARSVTHIINEFHQPVIEGALSQHQQIIDDCFSLLTVEDIMRALRQHATVFAEETLAILAKKSPMSLKVTLRALQQGSTLDFDACMQQEIRLAKSFVRGHDFLEGIRAVIIDKDNQPLWRPDSLDRIKDKDVDKYFADLTTT